MSLFYNSKIHLETDAFIFSPEESKHIYKVLRKVPGDNITVTNGKGLKWKGELTQVGNKNTEVKKIEATKTNDTRYGLEIAIAPTKSNDRMEWFIEKATEIGITKIHFIKTENSERKKINLNRFQFFYNEFCALGLMSWNHGQFIPFLDFLNRLNMF